AVDRGRDAAVDGRVHQDLAQLVLGDPVIDGALDVPPDLLGASEGDQHGDREHAAGAAGNALAPPDRAEAVPRHQLLELAGEVGLALHLGPAVLGAEHLLADRDPLLVQLVVHGSSLVSSTSNDIRFSQPPPSTGGPPMTENLHLVFSKPPEAISDEEYNRWYDFHLGEILVVPGFVSARPYRLETVKGGWAPSGHRSLSASEIEAAPRDVMSDLDKQVAPGRMHRPSWFPRTMFDPLNCHSHGNPAEARLADHLYLVFSAPPEGLG